MTIKGNNESLSWQGKRLTNIGNNIEYRYNPNGIRIYKSVNNEITRYQLEDNLIQSMDKTIDNVIHHIDFHYDINNQIVGLTYNNEDYFYIRNVLGTILGIINSSGNLITRYTYSAYGVPEIIILASSGNDLFIANNNPFLFKGYYYDDETGLFMMGHRFYDPEIGRFISPDDVDYLDPTSIGGLNLYAYCNNDPVNYYDPSGHIAISIGLLIAGFVVGALVGAGSSIITQGLTDGFENINGWQVLLDGTIGGISGLLAFSGVGALGSAAISGGLGFIGSVGGDLIRSNGDWNGVNWGKAAVMTGMNFLLGWGPGVQNSKAIGKSLGSALSGNKGLNAIFKVMSNPKASSKGIQGVINLYGKTLSNGIHNVLPGIMMRRIDDAFAVMLSTCISSILFDFGADYFGFWE